MMISVFSKFLESFSNSLRVGKSQLNVMTIVIPEDSIFIDIFNFLEGKYIYIPFISAMAVSASVIYAGVKHFETKRILYKFDEMKYKINKYDNHFKHGNCSDYSAYTDESDSEDDLNDLDEDADYGRVSRSKTSVSPAARNNSPVTSVDLSDIESSGLECNDL